MQTEGKMERIANIAQSALVVVLVALVTGVLVLVNGMQGNARVVNYAGIVRGETQRLVKLELADQPNDAMIQALDGILSNLQSGSGQYRLARLPDSDYLANLQNQARVWETLKEQIDLARQQQPARGELLQLSEEYFQLADSTVQAAERYSDDRAARLQVIQIALICNIALLVLFLLYKSVWAVLLRKRNAHLHNLAFIDANTGLPNKGRCDQLLLEEGILDPARVHACVMFDLNNLKVVNDTYGHKTGDSLILNFAEILRGTAPQDVFLGRYGGDEFIAVLHDTDEARLKQLLGNIEKNVQEFREAKSGIPISYAVGYALSCGRRKCTLQMLLDSADKSMYEDKLVKKKLQGLA